MSRETHPAPTVTRIPRRKAYRRGIIACTALVLLAGCGGGRSAPERYAITPMAVEAPRQCPAVSLKIYEPIAAPGLDTWRIAVLDRPNHLTYYKAVSWSATAARTVQHALADMLGQSGAFANISTDLDTVPAAYHIESELAEFNTDLSGPEPVVRTRLTATLLQAGSNRLLATIPLVREDAIEGRSMQQIADLFAAQLHSMSEELIARAGDKIPGCR